ncbi:MAG: agmatinase [Acidobacteriota bacterium]
MRRHAADFLGLDADQPEYGQATAVVLPLPFERTTSYGSGTDRGPQALLEASAQVELYDQELDAEPVDQGIFTVPAFEPVSEDLAAAMDEMEREARRHLDAGKFLVTLGGEHSLTLAPVRAALGCFGAPLGVVQFDAHADLRDTYGGTPYSHAAVMRRVLDLGLPTVAVGIRSLSQPEAQLIRQRNLPVIWSDQLEEDARLGSTERFERFLDALPERIYLTFDIDYFDPSLVPATGTPEPGGGTWHPTLELLRILFERKRVVAMDVVELAPRPGWPASDFVAAKLVYKCLGYRWRSLRDRGHERC